MTGIRNQAQPMVGYMDLSEFDLEMLFRSK